MDECSSDEEFENAQPSNGTQPRAPRQFNADLLHANPVLLPGQPKEEKMQIFITIGGSVTDMATMEDGMEIP